MDCLNSSAWLDLSREPIVLSVPQTNRYFLLSVFSGWYEIFGAISSRVTGKKSGHFGFVGPNWSGRLPFGIKCCAGPTDFAFVDGYFAVAGAEDVQAAHRLQDQFALTPLSRWGVAPAESAPFRPGTEHKSAPQQELEEMDAGRFYTQLAKLLHRNGPQSCDSEILAECARIGFFPGEDFVFETLPADTIDAMQSAVPAAQSRIAGAVKNPQTTTTAGNWSAHTHPGRYHKDYLARAVAARSAGASVLADDITCMHTSVDRAGESLSGTRAYVLTFNRDQTPPVHAFWSITVYDRLQRTVPNNIHRYAIGDRDRLRLNPDSSLSVYMQHDWPGADRDSNWLPVPKDSFNLAFRMYWPKPEVLTGKWRPPAVTRMS